MVRVLVVDDSPTVHFHVRQTLQAEGHVIDRLRNFTELPAYLAGTGYYPSGLPVLRDAVAAAYDERGLPTDPEQVLVVPGALAGVAIAAGASAGIVGSQTGSLYA